MKVIVNQEACVGCGACAAVAEDLFEINDSGQSTVKADVAPDGVVPKGKEEEANDAVNSCPTGAITAE